MEDDGWPLSRAGLTLLNIGWLDSHHQFTKGSVPPGVLARVADLCMTQLVNPMRGFHGSPFSREYDWGYPLVADGESRLLRSAEIRVVGSADIAYAAPNLIYHYIRDVGYRPPDEFIDAVLK